MKNIRGIIIACFTLYCNNIHAQNQPYENLVFEGAGIRGIAYAGALGEFEKSNVLNSIKKVGGTSAGAIIALSISLGYNSNEIEDIISNTQFNKFNDGGIPFFGGLHRIQKLYGWYRGERFSRWVETLIESKTGNADITFSELHHRGFRDLYVTATCLNKQRLVILSHETYPEMKIKDAVRISMSIPLYFKAVFVDRNGSTVKKPRNRTDLDIMLDGGITGNYPIDMFDSIDVNSKSRKINHQTIGLRIDTEEQMDYDRRNLGLVPLKIHDFKDYMTAFYVFVLENLNRNQLTAEDWQRTISISSVDIAPRIKRLSTKQKDSLISSGRKSTIDFLKKNHSQATY